MTEFFHDCTTNERKRELEELLDNFAQQIGAWRFCLYFLSSTRNDYVMMYSLTVFEVSCQILLYYSEEYFLVTLPCYWH